MIFDWFRNRHRKDLLETPFPREWEAILDENVAHYMYLTEEERRKLKADLLIFAHEKNWEGCGGQEITDEVRVTIAAQACLLLLNLPYPKFAALRRVLVYPDTFVPVQVPSRHSELQTGPVPTLGQVIAEVHAWWTANVQK